MLVFFATLRPNKGLEDLIDAIEVLKNESFLLMIVGTDEDNYCQKLKQRVENSILKDRVIFSLRSLLRYFLNFYQSRI